MAQRGRGRPREYDPDTALRRSLDTFWRHGFSATSLDQLSAATGMNRPSLYAAFGDKRSIYLKSLDAFAADLGRRVTTTLGSSGPLTDVLTTFYAAMLDLFGAGTDEPLGCLAICTASVEAPTDEPTRSHLDHIITLTDAALTERFRQAQREGELSCTADPQALGVTAAAVLHTLAIRTRAGRPRTELDALAASVVSILTAG